MTFILKNPATEEIISEVPQDSPEQIQKKFNEAQAYQTFFKNMSFNERLWRMQKFLKLLKEKENQLAHDLSLEVGKPITQSHNEIKGAIGRVQFFLDESEKYLKTETVRTLPEAQMVEKIVYEPLGIVASISAWNYPYLVSVNVLIPALLAGNCVLYKPSEYAYLSGRHLVNLLHESGFAPQAIALVSGDGQAGQALLNLPINACFFTGSLATGKKIAQVLGPKMIPFGLELGGKDPIYIMDDVELDSAAEAVADGAFYNNGQSCCSVERIYVHQKIWEPFVEHFVKTVASWKLGNPLESDTYFGPLTQAVKREHLKVQIQDALSKGAQLLLGGHSKSGPGYYFEPTILINTHENMLLNQEESFGPIIGLEKVQDDDEAIRKMNQSVYGLTAGVYGKNAQRAEAILSQMEAGSVYFNCCDRVSPYLPWSGRKSSGLGSTLSHIGIRTFVKPKAYHWKG